MLYKNFANDLREKCEDNNSVMITYDFHGCIRHYTYSEVYTLVLKYKNLFTMYGLRQGDTICAILPNSPEAIVCFFASLSFGINYAPLPCNVTKREVDNWNGILAPSLYIIKKDILDFEISEEKSIEIDADGNFEWLHKYGEYDYGICNSSSKIFLLTSGTTGIPKAMQIDCNVLWTAGMSFVEYYKLQNSQCKWWNFLPMSYLGGLFNLAMIPLICNGSFVISEPFSGKTVLNFWNFVRRHNIDAIWFVPSIVHGLLKLSDIVGGTYPTNISRDIKVSSIGTAPISYDAKTRFEELFKIKLFENYALSETTFLTAENNLNIRHREEYSVGELLPYADIKLVPIEGNICSIWVKTPFLFDGYLTSDGSIYLELDGDGYFNTNDVGHYNEDNVLILTGRTRDIIKKGGLFVSLSEIEVAVEKLEYIENAVAIPMKHDFYGEAYYLCLVIKNTDSPKKIINKTKQWMIDNFVPYKQPEKIFIINELPTTPSGKIKKDEILKKLECEYEKV